VGDWQPIETAPKGDNPKDASGPAILVAAKAWLGDPLLHVGEAYWYAGGECWMWANLDSEYGDAIYPTHWMPLPEPPQQETARG
jgi:hypothetical protein